MLRDRIPLSARGLSDRGHADKVKGKDRGCSSRPFPLPLLPRRQAGCRARLPRELTPSLSALVVTAGHDYVEGRICKLKPHRVGVKCIYVYLLAGIIGLRSTNTKLATSSGVTEIAQSRTSRANVFAARRLYRITLRHGRGSSRAHQLHSPSFPHAVRGSQIISAKPCGAPARRWLPIVRSTPRLGSNR
jgi:hypothetical protein